MISDLFQSLQSALKQNAYQYNEQVISQLVNYLTLVQKWNKVYNLTRIKDLQGMIFKHILDSLSIETFLHGQRILDVGTGAGFPGIPLAIIKPDLNFVLIDSNGKKTRFLNYVIQQIGLPNVEIIQGRVEQLQSTYCFDTIISRAFSSIIVFLQKTQHLICKNGIFLAMKGQYPEEELKVIPAKFSISTVRTVQINGLNETRHVIVAKLAK